MIDFDDDQLPPAPFEVDTMGKLLKEPRPPKDFLLPGLLQPRKLTIVRVEPGVLRDDVQMFALGAGHAVASGGNISPFGSATPGKVLIIRCGEDHDGNVERVSLLNAREQSEECRNLAHSNLGFHRHPGDGVKRGYLRSIHEQDTLAAAIPDRCRLVIVPDANYAFYRNGDPQNFRNFSQFSNALNQKGIATLIFFFEDKKAGVVEDDHFTDKDAYIVELKPNPAAPCEFGGSFDVHRPKVSVSDPVPSNFQFWYALTDGELEFGWQMRDSSSIGVTAKRVEVAERQRMVKKLKEMGMPNKDIAEKLEVSQATISRDLTNSKPRVSLNAAPDVDDDFA